jgi:cyclin C
MVRKLLGIIIRISCVAVITKLGKKLQLRQRVIATATVFFRRFYLKNKYCETDPFIVVPACVYVAAKAEESPVHIKNVISESRSLFSQTYGIKTFPSDNHKLAEMEFYLVDDLECDMVVYHPYRTLLALCRKEASTGEEGEEGEAEEAGELGTGIGAEDGPSYWGSGHGKLVISEEAFQTTWYVLLSNSRTRLTRIQVHHKRHLSL